MSITSGRTSYTAASDATGTSTRHALPLDLSGRAILLATDGTPSSVAAAHVAAALAASHHAKVHVLSVIDTRSAPLPPPLDLAIAIGDAAVGEGVHAAQEAEVRTALSAALGQQIDWPVRVKLGAPDSAIVHEARHLGAVLVIVGLRRHGRFERALQDETALNVMHNAFCPVLGVIAGATELPKRVLAAVDFSETSLIAARTACAVVGEGAMLVLAYVPPLPSFVPEDGESVIHELGVQAGFARTARDLAEDGVTFDHVVLHRQLPRPTAEMLLEYAEGAKIDLVAAGSARHGRLDRWILGSVSTDLVRDGRRSVLIVPPLEEPSR